jgi:hypothetical protein
MALPPEVLLDRFLKSDQRSQVDRATYRGKQDLLSLEPSLRSLLADVQDALNAALRQRTNTFAKGQHYNFHFDYVDATSPNALAFEHEGYAFIVVTMPLVKVLWHMCDQLSRSNMVTEILRGTPTDRQREAILAVLFTTQLAFVVGHEFAHHDRGHFSQLDSTTDLWKEIPAADAAGSLEEQAREIDADGWAVYLVLTHLIMGQRRDGTKALLALQAASDDSVDEVLLSSFIVAVAALLFVFPPVVFDELTLYRLTHPPQAARMNEIMHKVQTWCQHNRPALEAWMTLDRFQGLMRATREASSTPNAASDWSKQTAFFLTQSGSEYFRRLHERVVSPMDDEETRERKAREFLLREAEIVLRERELREERRGNGEPDSTPTPSASLIVVRSPSKEAASEVCKCGYPGCIGHEVIDNHAIFPGFTSEAVMAQSPHELVCFNAELTGVAGNPSDGAVPESAVRLRRGAQPAEKKDE